jgi:hypothetical protein
MTTMIQNSADCALESTSLDLMLTDITPSDVMPEAPILFSFVDYLCARRGIDHEAALELIGSYMFARAAAHAEATHPSTATEPQCTNEVVATNH